ncbi:hypothetical protein HGM15179_004387 [Zosterops borbonicus]|uniref:Uncharacterized protein n=1 Tax=Zosterops borbonicus TaxID=364589 RepID=A0A8K1GP25_9PASS|nr:hypothetical protein HGM15179_004387 [Zosterops borbonicus]
MIKMNSRNKDWGVFVDEKLNVTHQLCTCSLATSKVTRLVEVILATLFCPCENSQGVVHPALALPKEERHGPVGTSPEESHYVDQRNGTPLIS